MVYVHVRHDEPASVASCVPLGAAMAVVGHARLRGPPVPGWLPADPRWGAPQSISRAQAATAAATSTGVQSLPVVRSV